MKIINKTKGTILADNAVIAQSLLKRTIGLLNRKNLEAGEALIISPCNSIHTFFMRFSIDVVFINKDYKVIKTISCLKPFRISRVYWLSSKVIELPAGAISSSNTQQGDLLFID
jgi:uncharacterized membrane protein (UPF0127 family)